MPVAANPTAGRDRFVGAQSLGVIVLALVALGIAIYVVSDLAAGSTSTSNRLSVGAVFGATAGLLIALGSARTFVRGNTVHVVSFVATYLVPVAEIVGVDDENGMAIRVTSGRAIGSMAFGASLIAVMTGNRRSKRAARRLTAIAGPFQANNRGWTQDTVQSQPRWQALGLCVGMTAVSMLFSSPT